jgi:hypothetical protein
MQSANRYDGVHPRAVKFIRFHARQLARQRAVPGLEIEDYEQEFMADLLERSLRFDSSRSSYLTFADRLIRNRVTSLLESGSRMRTTSAGGHDGHAIVDAALETEGLWPTSRLPAHERACLRLDLERFIEQLPNRLRLCCAWLMALNRRAAASGMGLHHSSLYEAAAELKQRAGEADLDSYLIGSTRHIRIRPGK